MSRVGLGYNPAHANYQAGRFRGRRTSWLEAEWQLPIYDQVRSQIPQSLIDSQDFTRQQNNQSRYTVLSALRSNMLNPLPGDTVWYSATYDRADLNRTYAVASNDWGPISGNTYRLSAVLQNLNRNDVHAQKIASMQVSLASLDNRIILVASDLGSFLTIIEGNHRGAAIIADAVARNAPDPLIQEVLVGVSPNMRRYEFHIEQYLRPNATEP
jgi:hypothetical protein